MAPGGPRVDAPLRIALVHPKFDLSGGAERYALSLAEGLARRGHDVHLFGRRASRLPDGLTFHRAPSLPLGRLVKTWSFCRAASLALRPHRFEVVQGFGKTVCQTIHRAGGGVHAAYLERAGSPGRTGYDRIVLRLERELFSSPRLRAVIAPSGWVAAEVARWYPETAERLRIIPNGVDTERFRPEGRESDRAALAARLGLPADGTLLLFAATNFALKGLSDALSVLPLLSEAHLVVAGGDDQVPFRDEAARLGVGARVHFLGAVRDVGRVYRAADVLLHPSRYDTFANVCSEALACGTPVVTTERAGAAEILGEAGRVVPFPCEAEALAAAARELLLLGESGRRMSREQALRFGLDAHTERVEALYREVAGG